MLTTLGVVVVHHRSEATVMSTVEDLLAQGAVPQRIVVVDNSEDEALADRLRGALGAVSVRLLVAENRGYANAVNRGVRSLSESADVQLVAVLTHEVRLGQGCLRRLVDAMSSDASIGAAGPALVSDLDRGVVWSAGGRLSKSLLLPSHDRAGQQYRPLPPAPCHWLDGAMVVYRFDVLASEPMDERFFLYYEETEYHTRLRSLGLMVVCFSDIAATQTTRGMPGWQRGRNGQIFQLIHGTPWSRLVAGPVDLARSAARALMRRTPWQEVGAQAGGWWSAWRERSQFAGPARGDRHAEVV